jgi:mono/diheme cytochrome c family protein
MTRFAFSALSLLVVSAVVFGAQPVMSRSAKDGVYTKAQASQGKTAYTEKCASCHGNMDSATPDMAPLLNDFTFQETWKERSVGQFFERIRRTMPQNEPGTLSPQMTAEIVAYILSMNRLPAGDAALSSDAEALREIRLDAVDP